MSGIPFGIGSILSFSRILVEQASRHSILGRIEKFSNPPFDSLCRAGRAYRYERPLSLAYLHYSIRVLRPSEGLVQLEALADAALKQWFSAKPLPGPAS